MDKRYTTLKFDYQQEKQLAISLQIEGVDNQSVDNIQQSCRQQVIASHANASRYIGMLVNTRKVKVLSPPETINEKSTFRAKAFRRALGLRLRRAFARNVDFSFIVSGSERTFTFRVSLYTLPTLAMLC